MISSNRIPIRFMSHFRPHQAPSLVFLSGCNEVRADPNNLVNPPIEEVEGDDSPQKEIQKSRGFPSDMIYSWWNLMWIYQIYVTLLEGY